MRISDWSSDVCSSDLAGEPLAQHVELIERRIAHAQPPAGAVMRNLDAKPQAVGQLPLEREDIGIGRCPAIGGFAAWLAAAFFIPRQCFGLADRPPRAEERRVGK